MPGVLQSMCYDDGDGNIVKQAVNAPFSITCIVRNSSETLGFKGSIVACALQLVTEAAVLQVKKAEHSWLTNQPAM